ncbi:pyridoxal phosphate-dependent aminotransferase [Neomoorella thermoacetica]|uniref:Aminotransferase n=3 Tax=Neomoorella thermoacetica TaxID=1525 RepID=A0A1J5NVE3_NEOTH|nr:pyridoxal phosphate-dependent aminotransferase [Moorella thermoacetica]AKX94777.1 aspartate aminotransferase [Moorella thermoacetica]AKX97409.1 aspartate aminotransferase [Moorella thermoacetica]APC09174.1 aspartate aminotransferase [Moorella thermoacetica]OIQ09027.1 aspartate aminotransferase [Moorella thermoacetica]OIQ12306.1 aspartate aminotransferase [Moorella thermoacetica]
MFEKIFADKMANLGTETAFMVLAKAKALEAQGKEIIHLEIGEPDFATPRNIIDAGIRALNEGYTHYTPAPGLPEVRATIAEYATRQKGVHYDPEEVVIVPGGKPIMFFTILALVNPGDEVIYPNPGFPIYESVINFVGGKAVPLPIREENDFRLDVDELAGLITPKTKLLIINSPANPTGGVLTAEDIGRIADLVRGKNIVVLADEIYDRIVYDGARPVSIAAQPGMKDWTIILDGFSKTYAMTGWRIGYGLMHRELADRIAQLMVNSNSCTAAFTQKAAQEALTGPQDAAEAMVAEFKKRRDIIVDGLNSIPGITCKRPLGSFYVFPNIKGLGLSSQELEAFLMEKAGVAALSGTAFGKYGEGYLRLSYANSVENIEKALEKIAAAVKELR